jgi:hypothetical protein
MFGSALFFFRAFDGAGQMQRFGLRLGFVNWKV